MPVTAYDPKNFPDPNIPAMALTIHLGAHKTASTHLQYSLRLAQPALMRGGVFYADPTQLRHPGLPLTDALATDEARYLDVVTARLAQARAVYPELLLSEENILGGTRSGRICGPNGFVYPMAVARVRRTIELAGGGPATLFLSVRDPAHFYVSAFALQMTYGAEVEFETYLADRDPTRIGWVGLVRRLASIAGVARVVVWRYEDYAALRPRLLARLLPPGTAGLVPDPPPANESVTQAGYEWFVKRALGDSDTDLRVLVRRARNRFPRAEGHAPMRPLDDAAYARSAQRYAVQVAQLCDLPKVEFLLP